MKNKSAFTLIELLVVIAIIALLLSIVTPALKKAKKHTEQVICASNLHQWGLGWTGYISDNHILPKSVKPWDGGGELPILIWGVERLDRPGEINLEVIAPYMPGFDLSKPEFGPAWTCPSNKVKMEAMWSYYTGGVSTRWTQMHYSYFAGVEDWNQKYVTYKHELSDKYPSGSKLLMADTLYRWGGGGGGWWFNHGKYGASVQHIPWGPVHYGVPPIIGTNQLFGDAHVRWKNENEFDPKSMENGNPNIRQTSIFGPGSDVCFW